MQFLLGSQFGTKRELLDMLLGDGMVMLHLDATHPGVMVPARHQGDLHLRLNLSLAFNLPDLEIDEDGVRASLSFSGSNVYCVMPWDAIFALTSHTRPMGYVWPEDLPRELAEQATAMTRNVVERQGASPRPAMRVVDARTEPAPQRVPVPSDTTNDAPDAPEEPDAPATEGRRYGHLRVVK